MQNESKPHLSFLLMKGIKKAIYIALLLCSYPSHATATIEEDATIEKEPAASVVEKTKYTFLMDRYYSPYAAAPGLISLRNGLSLLESTLYPTLSIFNNPFAWIIIKAIDFCFDDYCKMLNHEVAGHGFRLKSRGHGVEKYEIGLLLSITFPSINPSQPWGHDARLLCTIGGSEANQVLAQEIVLQNFRYGYMDQRMAGLFLHGFADLPAYTLLSYFQKLDASDISSYLDEINMKHAEGIPWEKGSMTLSGLAKASLVYFFNPIFYTSLWAFLTGSLHTCKIPTFRLGNYSYMPILRVGFTPFGLQYYLDNYISDGTRTLLTSLHAGKFPFYRSYYFGIKNKTNNLYTYKAYSLDVEGSLWYQPALCLQNDAIPEDVHYWGGLIGIHNQFRCHPHLALDAHILYKTKGFTEGVSVQKGFQLRGGFTFFF